MMRYVLYEYSTNITYSMNIASLKNKLIELESVGLTMRWLILTQCIQTLIFKNNYESILDEFGEVIINFITFKLQNIMFGMVEPRN